MYTDIPLRERSLIMAWGGVGKLEGGHFLGY